MLVVHGLAQLPDLLLNLRHFLGGELILVAWVALVQLQQLDHELQTRSVQIHVEPISTQDVHQGGGAQSKVLKNMQKRKKKKKRISLYRIKSKESWFNVCENCQFESSLTTETKLVCVNYNKLHNYKKVDY